MDAADTQLVFDLFCQASLFRIANLQDRCEHVLLDCVDDDNVCTLFEAADRYGSSLLRDVCLAYIFRFFDRLSEQAAFDMLPVDLVLSLKGARVNRGLHIGPLEKLLNGVQSEEGGSTGHRYIDELGADCPHCSLPFVFSRRDWMQAATPKDILSSHTKGQAEFRVKIIKSQQMGHLACVFIDGVEYFRTRPYGSKRDAEQNVALYALHILKCQIKT